MQDFSYIGSMKNFNRGEPWHDDDSGGFGDSYGDYEDKVFAGNTFNYPTLHGEAALKAGVSFVSCGSDAVADGTASLTPYKAIDLILGKQEQTKMGTGDYYPLEFKTFPAGLQKAITAFTAQGGSVFTSGSYVASDLWCNPVAKSLKADRDFAQSVLHYKWMDDRAARGGEVSTVASPEKVFHGNYQYFNTLNPDSYAVESPDGIEPTNGGATIMRYTENNISAGVAWKGNYRTVTLGFPFESIKKPASRESLMLQVLTFFGMAK